MNTQKPIGFILKNKSLKWNKLPLDTFEPYTTGELLKYPHNWMPVYKYPLSDEPMQYKTMQEHSNTHILKRENSQLKKKLEKKQFDASQIEVWWKTYYENKLKNVENGTVLGMYMVHIIGSKNSPTTFHDTQQIAELEAIRLTKKELSTSLVLRAVSKFELNDVKKTDLINP